MGVMVDHIVLLDLCCPWVNTEFGIPEAHAPILFSVFAGVLSLPCLAFFKGNERD